MIPVPTKNQISPILGSKHTILTRLVTLAKRESVKAMRLDPPNDTEV